MGLERSTPHILFSLTDLHSAMLIAKEKKKEKRKEKSGLLKNAVA